MSKKNQVVFTIIIFVLIVTGGQLVLHYFPELPQKFLSTKWGAYIFTGAWFLIAILKIGTVIPNLRQMNLKQMKSEIISTGAILVVAFFWKDLLSWLSFPQG